MENTATALWETRIAEMKNRISELQATGASKKRLAYLRRELESYYSVLRTTKSFYSA